MTRPKPALALAPLEPPSKGTLVSRTLCTPPSTPQRAEAGDTLTAHAGRWVTGEMLVHLSRQGDPPGWGGGSECRAGGGLQQGYSSPVEAAKLQGRGRSSRAVAAARRQQACHGWAAAAGLQQQGCSSRVQPGQTGGVGADLLPAYY